jgi:hypothetical protein
MGENAEMDLRETGSGPKSSGSEQGSTGDYCEHCNKFSGSIKEEALLEYLSDCQLLIMDCFMQLVQVVDIKQMYCINAAVVARQHVLG